MADSPPWTPDDFDYALPPAHIAQTAAEPRDSSRLMVVHRRDGRLEHRIFRDLPDYLRPGDALVLNQTRVIPARLHGVKIPSGGAVEALLVEKITPVRWLALVGGKRIREGTRLTLRAPGGELAVEARVVEVRDGSDRVLEFEREIEPLLDMLGETPLPPYIHTPLADPERYQTVYARAPGSVAAPTAGLHFTPELLLKIRDMGVALVYCTLHVGPGTFLPVRAEQIAEHRLHAERAQLTAESALALNRTRLRGGRIVAVGTTSVRTLETAALRALDNPADAPCGDDVDACPWGAVAAFSGATDLFIMPGFRFRTADMMVTNFHLPRSTLLMLVSAFAGRELMLRAYAEAREAGYRFYSLGDACLLMD
ncbi:MAG: tRNA preQ1(34) S-adenosylmethionine ribosyltransferase-isomerase QueA [Anaerolineae bacterium]|nr:tRNA preQ1(34) S-adenosylmethionine ribosyltransferase-isomerase QueA [Anaerolineae bacterium]